MTPLRTARLVLRPFQPGDAEALHPTLSDPAAMTWWSRGPLESLDATRAYLARDTPGWTDWYFAYPDAPALGWVSTASKRNPGVSEIGYLLAAHAGGQGLAREAVAVVIGALFAGGQRRVFADTDPDNAPSCRLLRALGFTLEGRLRDEWETHIGIRDSLIWGLLVSEWPPTGGETGIAPSRSRNESAPGAFIAQVPGDGSRSIDKEVSRP